MIMKNVNKPSMFFVSFFSLGSLINTFVPYKDFYPLIVRFRLELFQDSYFRLLNKMYFLHLVLCITPFL